MLARVQSHQIGLTFLWSEGQRLATIGNVSEQEMYRTFNMGVGMVVVTGADDAGRVREHFDRLGEASYDIGSVVEGSRAVTLKR